MVEGKWEGLIARGGKRGWKCGGLVAGKWKGGSGSRRVGGVGSKASGRG